VRRLVTIAIFALGAVLACAAPSVPVPPPSAERQSFALDTMAGTATYEGNLGADWVDSWVIILVDRTGDGVVARTDMNGHVGPTDPFSAIDGDRVNIEFERDDGVRTGICLILHAGQSSDSYRCDTP
jgi:hypothetical protein